MGENCYSLASWVPYALAGVGTLGALIGFSVRLVLDRAELEAYRRVARRP